MFDDIFDVFGDDEAEPAVAEPAEDFIDREAVEAARALFGALPPSDDAYADSNEVSLTLTKGQIYELRGALRHSASGFLSQVALADSIGYHPTQEQAHDTNEALRHAVEIDAILAPLADTADYASATQDDFELVV